MMGKGLFVTATDTGVGKTFFCATFIKVLKDKAIDVSYFKPFSTGCINKDSQMVSEDMLFVEAISGLRLDPHINTPIRFLTPASPLCAAMIEKRPIKKDLIFQAFEGLMNTHEFLVVEGIGGVMVPLWEGYLVLDLIRELGLPALVIARPSLGTINHSLLTLNALERACIPVIGFYTSGMLPEDDPTTDTNPSIIEGLSHVRYLGHIPFVAPEELPKRWPELEKIYGTLMGLLFGGIG